MSIFTRKNNVPVCVSPIEKFQSDIEAFESWAENGVIANSIVIKAIRKAEVNGIYVTLTGLQKEYARVTNDAAYGKKYAV